MTKDECIKVAQKLMITYKIKKETTIEYIGELRNYEYMAIINAIDELSKKSTYTPTVAELKNKIEERTSFKNINLNSCYWYINERMWCDEHNKPYYDITTGQPLEPYRV